MGAIDTADLSGITDDTIREIELLTMEVPTVISASRREQKLSELPSAVSVITKEDLRLSGARTVTDALRLVPGMDVAELTYGHTAAQPRGIHGFVGRNALVLIDGHQIYDALFGGPPWGLWPMMIEDIERIEVVRGPAGVTWGANAVNGLVNIVTKDPIDQQGLTAIGTGGSRGVAKEYTGYGIKVDKLRLRVSGEYERTDGFRKGGSFLAPLDDDYKSGRGSVHAIYDATPNDTFTVSGANSVISNIYPVGPQALFLEGSHNGSQASYIMGRWRHRIADDNRIEATAFVNDCWSSNGTRPLDFRFQQYGFSLGHTYSPAPNHTLTYGLDSRVDYTDCRNGDPHLTSKDVIGTAIVGVYAEDEWRFAPKWALTLGGRLDYEFYGGFQPSARISLSRELTPDSMVYTAVSRGYQMPPSPMRFMEMPMVGGLMTLTADQELRPTTIIAYEAGYRTMLFNRLNMDFNLFCHQYDDFITIVPGLGPPGLLAYDIRNAASIVTYGLEWEGRYALTDNFTLLGNYTLELTDWRGPSPIHETDVMAAPRNKFMVGARYSPLQDLHLSAHMYYADSTMRPDPLNQLFFQNVPAYLRLDLRAEYEFWQKRAALAVGVRNLLDPDHPEGGSRFVNYAEVPRMVYAELRLRLN